MPNLNDLRGAKGRGADLDRSSAADAGAVLRDLQPDPAARKVVVELLAHGIRTAHGIAPGCWSVALFPRALRLNVGRLLALEVMRDRVWLVLLDDAPDVARLQAWVREGEPFRSLEAGHRTYVPPGADLVRLAPTVLRAFVASVPAAAATSSRSSYRQSWSPGVAAMIEDEAGIELPRPDWLEAKAPEPARDTFLPSALAALDPLLASPDSPLDVILRDRAAFCERFSPERLAALSGTALLDEMHGRTRRDSLAYWLEFKSDADFSSQRFGGIRGGSALKFGLFNSEAGDWMTGAARAMRRLTEAEAVAMAEGQRDEILAAHEVLDRLPDDPEDPEWSDLPARIAQAAPTIRQLAFVHKLLTLWHPDKIDDFHSLAWHNHVLSRLGVLTPGESLYDAAAPFTALLQTLRAERPALDMQQVTGACSRLFGHPHGHWRIGTSEGDEDRWPEMRDGQHVGVGWDALGDLSDLLSGLTFADAQERLKPLLAEHYPSTTPQVRGRAASQIATFFTKMAERDLVYAAKGQTIVGVGEILGPYRFEDGAFPHRRSVRWLTTHAFESPSPTGLRTTVYNLATALDIQVAAARAIQAERPAIPNESTSPVRPPRALSLVEEQLERKGQVILYGPPGTGKTHHALHAAQAMAAWGTHGKPWASLTVEEKRALEGREGPGQRIWTCTFHPAFSYEDFVEGLRPVANAGQLGFEPRPGVFRRICTAAAAHPDEKFVLVVDEFNRGDAPRIFGELLTVLELDKRERVAVTLPTSGDSFTVPRNVYLIATMNTADRSIALLDAALRRRFGFIEYLPDATVLQDGTVEGIGLAALLTVLNERLLKTLGDAGRNRQIGHAYLLNQRSVHTLRSAFQYDILPLLQDYCSDDGDLLEELLGDGLYDRAQRRFRQDLFAPGKEESFLAAVGGLGDIRRDDVEVVDDAL